MKIMTLVTCWGFLLCFGYLADAADFAFPASGAEEIKSTVQSNRKPVFIPARCKENELFYPGDQVNDWVCDCQQGFLYFPDTDKCYGAYTRGPCASGQYLILEKGQAIPTCITNPCGVENQVVYNSKCYALHTKGPCPMPELNFVIGVNATTLSIQCMTESLQFQLRFGEEVEYGSGCGAGSKRAINGKCVPTDFEGAITKSPTTDQS